VSAAEQIPSVAWSDAGWVPAVGDEMGTFTGTSSDDIFTGGSDADTATGRGAGNDSLSGNGGNDILVGNSGTDTLNGGDGDDYLASGDASPSFGQYNYPNTSLDSGTEQDTLIGGAGADQIEAGYGDNVDGGSDGLFGDTLWISFLGAPSGITADFSQFSQTFGGGSIKDVENASWIQGSNYDDYITAADRSIGYEVYGTVLGMGGNDHLVAGFNTHTMDGGDGDDIVDGRNSYYESST
jgi:hypothetical protein